MKNQSPPSGTPRSSELPLPPSLPQHHGPNSLGLKIVVPSFQPAADLDLTIDGYLSSPLRPQQPCASESWSAAGNPLWRRSKAVHSHSQQNS
ncbi:unnamed protein product [Urochloa humidicola]